VDAPATGDPRVHATPIEAYGGTIIPLTHRTGGQRAFKQIVRPDKRSVPTPGTHEGYEWLYVLDGRLRLVLGEHDLVLGPGEVAEFDTRMHVRARPQRTPPR